MSETMAADAAAQSLLTTVAVDHPEWRPLLVLIVEALREATSRQWTPYVPALEYHGSDGRPLLDGAVFHVPLRLIERWTRHLLASAADAGTRVEPLARAIATGRLSPRFLFETAVSQNVDRVDELATVHQDNRGILRALSPLIAMPLLQACRRAWADRVPAHWAYGYCPICGGWPALAENRGLEGDRYLRCAPCGTGWRIQWRRCAFCGEVDDEELGVLVSVESVERHAIDVCDRCRRYVKTITTLTPIRPEDVVLHDLATLVLDVVALEHDYYRPAATPHRVELRVIAETWRVRDLLGLRR